LVAVAASEVNNGLAPRFLEQLCAEQSFQLAPVLVGRPAKMIGIVRVGPAQKKVFEVSQSARAFAGRHH
jgi:hypothetical protein